MRNKTIPLLLIILMLFLFTSCNKVENKYTDEMYAMDTIIQFTVYGDESTAKESVDKAKDEIKRLDTLFSISSNGDVASINSNAGSYVEVSEETHDLISYSLDMSKKTDGNFNIAILPLMELWGFTTSDYKVPSKESISETLSHIDLNNIVIEDGKVKIDSDMGIDLGGIAKGYITDKAINVLKENGISSAIINAGGNVATLGVKEDGSEYNIAVQDPRNESNYFALMNLSNKSAVTSGAYQRNFEEDGVIYHHIMDPKTGYPADSDISSITIISDDGKKADVYSTSLYIMGIDKAIEFYNNNKDFDFVIINQDYNEIYVSSGIKDNVSLNSKANLNII